MNERVKLLAEQAGMEDYPHRGINTLYGDVEIEKFAELIIEECFKIVDDYGIEQAGIAEENYSGEQLYFSMKITDSAYKIKEHFGIE